MNAELAPLADAAWIGSPLLGTGLLAAPSPLLRTRFTLASAPRKATLWITALGLYEAELNGHRIGNEWFAPGWTDYAHRLHVQSHDLGDQLPAGDHVLGVMLGDGWYAGNLSQFGRGTRWGKQPMFKAALVMEHADGSTETISTGDGWEWAEGPIRASDLLDGEHFDACREVDGWSGGSEAGRPTHPAGVWHPAPTLRPPFDPPLRSDNPSPPVRVIEELAPVADPVPGLAGFGRTSRVFDFGQNFAGAVRLRVRGPRGLTLRLQFAEVLEVAEESRKHLAVRLDRSNLRQALATDGYTLRGDPDGEEWTPRFTFHGFRYCEVAWSNPRPGLHDDVPFEELTRESLTGLVLANDIAATGSFETGHALLNRLNENIRWGLLSNFLEVPTDCPQRDERLGWTGDIQVFAPTAAFHRDVSGFLQKWMRDVWDAQAPEGHPQAGGVTWVAPNVAQEGDSAAGWSDAAVNVPWAMHRAYGDREALAESWDGARRWMDFQRRTSVDGLRDPEAAGLFPGFGDWLDLEGGGVNPFSTVTPNALVASAYYARSLGVFGQIARALGHESEARQAERDRDHAAAAFAARYLKDGHLTVPSQTAHLMALAFDLLPEGARPGVFQGLLALLEKRDMHLATGFLGTPLLCPTLERFGRMDLAMDLLLTETYPGWLYSVKQGATTMWERWNSWSPDRGFVTTGMNSLNHYAYGAVGDWMVRSVGGLDFAYGHEGPALHFHPHPDARLGHAATSLETPLGKAAISWKLNGDAVSGTCTVPESVPATLALPGQAARDLGPGEHAF